MKDIFDYLQEQHESPGKNEDEILDLLERDPTLVFAKDPNYGLTPLHMSVQTSHLVTEFLLNRNADVNAVNIYGASVLAWACVGGRMDIVKLLIDKGASKTMKDKDGRLPIGMARIYGHMELVNFLKE